MEINTDHWHILATFWGTTLKKLEMMKELVYNYEVECIGTVEEGKVLRPFQLCPGASKK